MFKQFKSKWHFFSVGIGVIPAIIDWYQIIQQIAVYWMLVVGVLLLLIIILLFTKSFQTDSTNAKANLADKSINVSIADQNVIEKVKHPNQKRISTLLKITSFLFLTILMLTISSIFYLKYKPIYYIRIENKNTIEAADKLITSINKKLINSGLDEYSAVRRRRSVNNIENNYMVCINGGYLSEEEALRDLAYLKSILSNYKNTEVKGSVGTSFVRKIQYLQTHAYRNMNRFLQVKQ